MHRTQLIRVVSLVLLLSLTTVAFAQDQPPMRRGPGFMGGPGLAGLLRMDQVRTELNLNEDQAAKVDELTESVMGEMRAKFESLRDNEDRGAVREQIEAFMDEIDGKMREELRGVLEREQMMRLYQIRSWVQPLSETLANEHVARRLEITEEQQKALAEATEANAAKRSEIMAEMREATQEARRGVFEKMNALRQELDDALMNVLTDEQKEKFDEMRGEKFEIQRPQRPGGERE